MKIVVHIAVGHWLLSKYMNWSVRGSHLAFILWTGLLSGPASFPSHIAGLGDWGCRGPSAAPRAV